MPQNQSEINILKRDLYVYSGTDSAFNCQALDNNGLPIDISEIDFACSISEYENGTTLYPATVSKTLPLQGVYQIIIDDTVKLTRPRYVYQVTGSQGSVKVRFQFGQILVE